MGIAREWCSTGTVGRYPERRSSSGQLHATYFLAADPCCGVARPVVHRPSAVACTFGLSPLPTETRCLGSTRRKDLCDLVGVVQVVTRVQADDVLHGPCTK